MRRREFFKMLAGLPFLAFLKGKEPVKGLAPSMSSTTSATTSWSGATWVNDTGFIVFKGQPIFYKDRLEA